MAKKKRPTDKRIQNRQARRDYDLGDSLLAGIQLSGAEVKSLRLGHGHLRGAYVAVKNNELWLVNATINATNGIHIEPSDQTRSRKLLLNRKEIDKIEVAKQQGNSIIPLELLTKTRYIKVRIAMGKGLKKYDKRQKLKRRDQDREAARAMR